MSLPSESTPNSWPTPDEAPLTPQQIDLRHANTLLERAFNNAERGEMDEALLACRKALHLAPQSFAAHSLLAMLLRRNDALDEAIVYSEKAHALVPDQGSEKERLALLRSARDNAQSSAPLQFGEWDKFRLELQREIKLSLMLEAQMAAIPPAPLNEPLPFANDLLLAAPDASPVFEPPLTPLQPASAASPKQSPKYVVLLSLAALAAMLSFLFVRGLQKTPAPQLPSAAQVASSNTTPPTGELPPQNNQPVQPVGEAPPAANGATAPATSAQFSPPPATQPVPASRVPATRSAPDTRGSSPAYQQATPRQAPASRPPAMSDVSGASRTSIPVPAPPANNEDPPARIRTPVREEEVGPRFSTPGKSSDENTPRPQKSTDDVGPRFSQP